MALNTSSAKIEITAVDKTAQAFNSIKSGIAGVGSSAAALSATLTGGAFGAFIKGAIDSADAMHDLSIQTGIAVEQLGAWKLATEQSGTSLEALARALAKGSKYMVEHGDNLKKLGITARTAEELILQLSGVIEKLPADDPRRVAISMEVLGKSAAELIPLLAEGESGLRKMLERGKELNPITKELADKANKFNGKLDEMKIQAGGVAYVFAVPLMDAFASLAGRIDLITKQTDRLKQLFDTLRLIAELIAELSPKPFMGPLGYLMGDDAAAGGRQSSSGKIRYGGGATTAQMQAAIDGVMGNGVDEEAMGLKNLKAIQKLNEEARKRRASGQNALDEIKSQMLDDAHNSIMENIRIEDAERRKNADYWDDFDRQNAADKLDEALKDADKRNEYQAMLQKQIEQDEANRLKQSIEDQEYLTDLALGNIKKQQDEWQKMTDQINQSLTDALMRAFESGKGWGKSFIETLQNMFNTLVLRPIISAIVSPVGAAISAGVTGMLGSGSALASGGAASGGGLGSLLSGGQSLWSAFSGSTGSMAASFATSAFGQAIGLSTTSMITAADVATGLAVELGSSATALTSAGSALVSAAPYIGLAIGAISLLGGFGGFGAKKVPKWRSQMAGTFDGTSFTSTTLDSKYKSAGMDAPLDALNKSFSTVLGTFLGSFGLDGRVTSWDAFKVKGKKSMGSFDANFAGGSVSYFEKFGKMDSQAAFEQMMASVMGSVLVEAIQKSQLSTQLKALFDGMTDKAVVAGMIDATMALHKSQDTVSKAFNSTADQAYAAAKATGLAGNALVAFVNQITSAALGTRSPGEIMTASRDALVKSFLGVGGMPAVAGQAAIPGRAAVYGPSATVSNPFAWGGNTMGAIGRTTLSSQGALISAAVAAVPAVAARAAVAGIFKTLPSSLEEYDNLIKGINKTTVAGAKAFADMLALRPQFIQYTAAIDGLSAGVKGAIFSMSSPARQIELMQADMSVAFKKAGVAIPKTVEDMIKLGESIDLTTTKGVDLASVFPTLVEMFTKTRSATDALNASLANLNENNFRTLVDFTRAQRYVGNGISYPVMPDPVTTRLPSANVLSGFADSRANNAAVLAELRKMREEQQAAREALNDIKRTNRNMDRTNEKWDGDGLPATRV